MKHSPRLMPFLAALGFLALAPAALSQVSPDVSLAVTVAPGGPGKATPTLTWSTTTPAPASCVGAGHVSWAGSKAVSGTQTLPLLSGQGASYSLACSWPATDVSATVTWTPPTTNVDGTPLTDLASFKVYYNTGDPTMVTAPTGKTRTISSATATSTIFATLVPGTYYFAVSAINEAGVESAISNIATKTIGGPTVIAKSAVVAFPGTMVITVK